MAPERSSTVPIQPQVTLRIKLLAIAVLAVLVWPVPGMVSFANPEEAVVLGRYTTKYFGLIVAYLTGVSIWVGVTVWCVWKLDAERLVQMRGQIEARPGLAVSVFAVFAGSALAVRSAVLAGWLVFPGPYAHVMQIIPSILAVLLPGLMALLAGPGVLQQIERRLARLWARLRIGYRWQQLQAAVRIDALIGLTAIVCLLIALVVGRDFWEFPLGLDPGLHVYLGEHVLTGGIPYQTILLFQPPARFLLGTFWSLGARLSGVPLVHFIRGVELAVACGILVVTYAIGRELSGRTVGGLLSAAILLSTEHLNELLTLGPAFRLTTVLFMLLGLWMAQRKRWFLAGVLAAVTALLYLPTVVIIAAIALSALSDEASDDTRWKASAGTLSGIALAAVGAAIGLAFLGALKAAYQQTVGFMSLVFAERLSPSGSMLPYDISYYASVFQWVLRGDWELAMLMVAGPVGYVAIHGIRNSLRSARSSGLLFALALLGGVYITDFDSGVRDTVMVLSLAAPFAAWLLIDLISRFVGRMQSGAGYLRNAVEWVTLGAVLMYGISDAFVHREFLRQLDTVALGEQQRIAQQLASALDPGEVVLPMGNQWYLIFAGQQAPTPFVQWHPEGLQVAEAAGWTPENMVQEVERQQPVVVMVAPPAPEFQPEAVVTWLDRHYTFVGTFAPASIQEQQIFVRNGRHEVEGLIATWPLVEGLSDHGES